MSTAREKSWFFQTPRTSAYGRFSRYNKPTEDTYRDLIASVPFFLDNSSRATASRLGLTLQSLDADVEERLTFANIISRHVEPYQIPMVMSYKASNPPDPEVGVPTDTAGIRVHIYEKSWTGLDNVAHTRQDLMVQLWPHNLDTGTPDTAADYIIFTDSDDGDTPKKVLADTLLGSGVWGRAVTTISPVNAGDTLDMGEGDIKGGDLYIENIILEAGSNRSIYLTSTTGNALSIYAGTHAAGAGGAIKLYGGTGSTYGGDAYLYGGAGITEPYANSFLCWDGSTKRGLAAIGGAAVTGMQLSIYGKLNVVSGGVRLKGYGTSAPALFLGLDASDDLQARTLAQIVSDLFGSPTLGDILYYNGSIWTRLAAPGTEKWLKNNAGTLSWDTPTVASDGKVKVDVGATADYLYDSGSGALRMITNGGLTVTDGGDYIEMEVNVDDLTDLSEQPSIISYIAATDASARTVKLDSKYLIGTSYAGWVKLRSTTDYTAAPGSTSRINTGDLTDYIQVGMPLKYHINGDPVTTYRYGIVSYIDTDEIQIHGDPLDSTIEELYIGNKEKVLEKTFFLNASSYNTADSTGLLEDIGNMKGGLVWAAPTSKLVRIALVNNSNDTTVNPYVNIGIGGNAVCTLNTNKGIAVDTVWQNSGVNIDDSSNLIEFGDTLEGLLDKNAGTGDADHLTITLTFILT